MSKTLLSIAEEFKKSQELIDKFAQTGELPRIEFDVLLSKLQYIYDTLYHYKSNQELHGLPVKEEKNDTISRDKENEKIKTTENKIPEPVLKHNENNDLFIIEEIKQEPTQVIKSPTIERDVIQQKENKPVKEIIAEKYKQHSPQINEVLSHGQHKKDVSSVMQSKPIKNLETAIGINEKYLFTHELFNGDAETYDKTIRILNNSANFNEAFNYLRQTFSWNLESPTAQKILDLVHRRFIHDED